MKKNGDHPWEFLANSGYKPDMIHNFFKNHPFVFLATHLQPKLEFKKKIPDPLPSLPLSLLAINNLVNHFISEFLIIFFSGISLIKKGSLFYPHGAAHHFSQPKIILAASVCPFHCSKN